MNFKEIIKPNKEKIILTIVGFSVFYLADTLILSTAEGFYAPAEVEQIPRAPWIFWVLRTGQELLTFYIISIVAYWIISIIAVDKMGTKTLSYYIKPNKINIILMLVGYAIFLITDMLLYVPLFNAFIPLLESPSPYSFLFSLINLTFYLTLFYLIGSFAHWLIDYFKK